MKPTGKGVARMQKKTPNNSVYERSFANTEFFKKQKEIYQERKKELDNERWENYRKKLEMEKNPLFYNNISYQKAKTVAVEVAKICQRISLKKDYVILNAYCNQVIRSSSSVLANMAEGSVSIISSRDKANRFKISCKEAYETIAWISLLNELNEITDDEATYLIDELTQIIKILSKAISTMSKNRKK